MILIITQKKVHYNEKAGYKLTWSNLGGAHMYKYVQEKDYKVI